MPGTQSTDLIAQLAEMQKQVAAMLERDTRAICDSTYAWINKMFPGRDGLSAAEMAVYWGVSENKARERMHEKDFPAERIGARITVSRPALVLYEMKRVGGAGQ